MSKKKYSFKLLEDIKLDDIENMQSDILTEYDLINQTVSDYSFAVHGSFEGPGPYCPTYPGSGAELC